LTLFRSLVRILLLSKFVFIFLVSCFYLFLSVCRLFFLSKYF